MFHLRWRLSLASLFLAIAIAAVVCSVFAQRYHRLVAWEALSSQKALLYDFSEVDEHRNVIPCDSFESRLTIWTAISSPYRLKCRAIDARHVTCIDSSFVKCICMFSEVEFVNLGNKCVDDDCMQYLVSLKKLRFLDLTGSRISEKSMNFIVQCESLRELRLDDTKLCEADILKLASMRSLDRLSIQHISVSDCTMRKLSSCGIEVVQ